MPKKVRCSRCKHADWRMLDTDEGIVCEDGVMDNGKKIISCIAKENLKRLKSELGKDRQSDYGVPMLYLNKDRVCSHFCDKPRLHKRPRKIELDLLCVCPNCGSAGAHVEVDDGMMTKLCCTQGCGYFSEDIEGAPIEDVINSYNSGDGFLEEDPF